MIEGATEQGTKHVNCDLQDRPTKEKTKGNTVHIKWIQINTDNKNYPKCQHLPWYFSISSFPTSCRQEVRSSNKDTLASGLSDRKIWSSCSDVIWE